jgi:membrane protease YdiL (CAAX protease family)
MDEHHNSDPTEAENEIADENSVASDPLEREAALSANQMLTTGVVFEGGMALLAIGLGWMFARPVWETIRWDAIAVLWGVAATVPMIVLLLVTERWPVGPLRGLKRIMDDVLVPLFAECRWWHLAVISALAGLGEELLFRGLIQTSLIEWLGVWPAVIGASALFGIAHPISKTYVVVVAVIGVYLGCVFIATDNLLVPIIAHGLYDFVALVYLTRRVARCDIG